MKTVKAFCNDITNRDHLELILFVSALFYLFREVGNPPLFQTTIAVISLILLLSKSMLQVGWLWLLMFLCALAMVFLERDEIDNHKFLMTYWLLVLALAAGHDRAESLIRFNGRALVGLVFLFAVIWKILPGEFMDGSFFHLTFLSENRFGAFSMFVGGLDTQAMRVNRMLFQVLYAVPAEDTAVILSSNEKMKTIALLSSYWTILIEGSIAVAFLAITSKRLDGIRDILLLLFVLTTYFLAPVISFGMVLCILGLSQCPQHMPRIKIAYVLAILLLQGINFMPEINNFLVDVLI